MREGRGHLALQPRVVLWEIRRSGGGRTREGRGMAEERGNSFARKSGRVAGNSLRQSLSGEHFGQRRRRALYVSPPRCS